MSNLTEKGKISVAFFQINERQSAKLKLWKYSQVLYFVPKIKHASNPYTSILWLKKTKPDLPVESLVRKTKSGVYMLVNLMSYTIFFQNKVQKQSSQNNVSSKGTHHQVCIKLSQISLTFKTDLQRPCKRAAHHRTEMFSYFRVRILC